MNDKETKILEDEFGDIHRLMEQAGSCIRLVKNQLDAESMERNRKGKPRKRKGNVPESGTLCGRNIWKEKKKCLSMTAALKVRWRL